MRLMSALKFNVQLPFSDVLQPNRDEKIRSSLVGIQPDCLIDLMID